MNGLPDLSHELIRLALCDMKLAEANPLYIINMDTWHSADGLDHTMCSVCMAGAVMANTMNANKSKQLYPESFPRDAGKLHALDDFRRGYVECGFNRMNILMPSGINGYIEVPEYDDDPAGFYAAMYKMADDLEAAA